MKNFISLVSILILSSSHSWAGGISGGGGFVINPKRPTQYQSPEKVEKIIKSSTKNLDQFIENKKAQWLNHNSNPNMEQIYKKLFANSEYDLHRISKVIDIEISDEHPCYSFEGWPVDGSINSKPGSVCISAKTISEKVHYDEIPQQALALSLHELSEVVGLTEEEAVQFQKSVLDDLL